MRYSRAAWLLSDDRTTTDSMLTVFPTRLHYAYTP